MSPLSFSRRYSNRRVTVSGPILPPESREYFYVDPGKSNEKFFLPSVRDGSYFVLFGPKASGKSSRMYRAIEQLQNEFTCLCATFQRVNFNDKNSFWSSFALALHSPNNPHISFSSISSASSFADLLTKRPNHKHFKNPAVLFIDDLDTLCSAPHEVIDSFLSVLRAIKQERHRYHLESLVGVGPFSVLELTRRSTSPFNSFAALQNPTWELEDIQELFTQLAEERSWKVDEKVITDVYTRTNGHAGLVCLCAKMIDEKLLAKRSYLSFDEWIQFATFELLNTMRAMPTMIRMVDSFTLPKKPLKANSPMIVEARELLYRYFLNNDNVTLQSEQLEVANFLAAEGILVPTGEHYTPSFKIPSPAIHSLILTTLAPLLHHNSPTMSVPWTEESIDVVMLIEQAIQYFDREIIQLAPHVAYKICYVPGTKEKYVPREDVYHAELYSTLQSWLHTDINFFSHNSTGTLLSKEISSSSTEKRSEAHRRTDIVLEITRKDNYRILLALVASERPSILEEHIERAANDAKALGAREAWVIHFTVNEEDTQYQYPMCASNSVNVLHVWHDIGFNMAKLVKGECTLKLVDLTTKRNSK